MTLTVTEVLDGLLGKFLRPLRTWIEREFIAPWKAAYDAAMQTKEQYRDGVYLHLRERLEGTDEHPLAEGVPVRPLPQTQDLEHLQSAVELLGERKIEDAGDVPDGSSFLSILCDSTKAAQITQAIDTNKGWTLDRDVLPSVLIPASLTKLQLGCKIINGTLSGTSFPNCTQLLLPELEQIQSMQGYGKTGIRNFGCTELVLPKLTALSHYQYYTNKISYLPNCKRIIMPELLEYRGENGDVGIRYCNALEEIYAPKTTFLSSYLNIGLIANCPALRKVVVNDIGMNVCGDSIFNNSYDSGTSTPNLIHLEVGAGGALINYNMGLPRWSPTNALRTDTTASDYIDLREDKDDSGEFINATNLEQFLANFRKYIIIRLANRTGQTSLTLTLSAAVYQNIYGLDTSNNADNNSWARTHTLADLGLTADDLTEAETAAGITINTIYATWLDTYRSAINWNIGH